MSSEIPSSTLPVVLSKIRPHTSSKLPHQKTPADLLVALEETLISSGNGLSSKDELTPVAYLGGLVSALEERIVRETSNGSELDMSEAALLPAVLYLLGIATPYVAPTTLRSSLPSLLPLLSPLFTSTTPHAPALRSLLNIFCSLFLSLDAVHLTSITQSSSSLRQSFVTVLQFTLDPRPKVRKRAQEIVNEVLHSAVPPLAAHPYADRAAEFAISVVEGVSSGSVKEKNGDGVEVGIRVLALVRPLAPIWPENRLPSLLSALIALPRLSSPHLTTQAYTLLSALLSPETTAPPESHVRIIVDTLLSSTPHSSNTLSLAPYLSTLSSAMVALARASPGAASTKLTEAWSVCWNALKHEDITCRTAGTKALCDLTRYCISTQLIEETALSSGNKKTILRDIINILSDSLTSLSFTRAIPNLLTVLTSLTSRLRLRLSALAPSARSRSPTAASTLLQSLILRVGDLRISRGFEYREQADSVLGMAIEVLGPEEFLDLLPLNLIPEESQKEGRAFLLPLLADRISNTRLSHFTGYFVPLSEKLFELQTKATEAGKAVEAKVWDTLISQIWATFKGYCDVSVDLKEAFSNPFARLLTQLLYTQTSLRTPILVGIRTMLRSTNQLVKSSAPPATLYETFSISQMEGREALRFLKSVAGNILGVLFNVFGNVGEEGRGLVGEVIGDWVGIAEDKEVEATYVRVRNVLTQNLSLSQAQSSTSAAGRGAPVPHTMLDLMLIMLPNLSAQTSQSLFDLVLSENFMQNKDVGIQKRSLRILGRLMEGGKIFPEKGAKEAILQKVVVRIGETTDEILPGAKRDRLYFLISLIAHLGQTHLHFIPALLPEAVLSTKEVSEKARTEAFQLLVVMGHKMAEGGTVRRGLVTGMDIDDEGGESSQDQDVQASVEEYFTMVAAGLAGTTPHMISATITSLSRLLFEFKDALPPSLLTELISTSLVFVSSANREIVKSSLGFVKLVVTALPVPTVSPHLSELVPALLRWSHDHKNHFKVKVRHIFERMIRRFGWNEVETAAGNDDGVEEGKKVLANIKKRRDRAKRKKSQRDENEDEDLERDDDEEAAPKPTAGDAFEDVLYGSESDLDDDDSDDQAPDAKQAAKAQVRSDTGRGRSFKKSNRADTRIRMDDDEPLDLLTGSSSKITALSKDKRRRPGQDAARFKTEAESGRMIIGDEDTDEPSRKTSAPAVVDDVAGNAYLEQMVSVDGFTRGPDGRVKFNKNTKKRRAEEAEVEMQDVEMADGTADGKRSSKKPKKKEIVRLGQEFKAKNAGGDVKRAGQQDPYAYLPLSKVGGKKRGGQTKVIITGKK